MKILKNCYQLRLLIVIFLILPVLSCRKILDVNDPPTSIDANVVYSDQANATAVLSSLYMDIGGNGIFSGSGSISVIGGVSADELTSYISTGNLLIEDAYKNNFNPAYPDGEPLQGSLYNYIYICNTAISGIATSKSLSVSVKQELTGEAKFCRAFLYFYLTNFVGDTPMPLTNNYAINAQLAKTPQQQIFQQIISDLEDARSELGKNYLALDLKSTTQDRIRPNYWAATALLARVYLYYGNLLKNSDGGKSYQNAATMATELITGSNGTFALANLDNVFLANNSEAIWQLPPSLPDYGVQDAVGFVLQASPDYSHPVSIGPQLLANFEPGDQRRTHWVGSFTDTTLTPSMNYYYPYKYKLNGVIGTAASNESLTILRLAEQYLILAEAQANLGNYGSAITNLDIIRSRSGLPGYTGPVDESNILAAIMHERRIEFFAEMGHRWLDLKRTGNVNSVMGGANGVCAQKAGIWASDGHQAFFPIPFTDIQKDPNLKQNPGY